MTNFFILLRVSRLIRSKDYQRIISSCENELLRAPDNFILRHWLALAYEANGDSTKALQQARLILESNPQDEMALRIAGGCLAGLERHEEAAKYVASYLEIVSIAENKSMSLRSKCCKGIGVFAEGEKVRREWVAWAKEYLQHRPS